MFSVVMQTLALLLLNLIIFVLASKISIAGTQFRKGITPTKISEIFRVLCKMLLKA